MVCQLIVQDEKNMMKSDFKKSLPIDEKNQIRNGEDYVGSCVDVWEGVFLLYVVTSCGSLDSIHLRAQISF